MRRSLLSMRAAKGRGWYKQFIEKGPESFVKNPPLDAFDWAAGSVIRPKVYLEMKLEEEMMGRIEIELAHDIVPYTVQNFLNLIQGNGPNGFTYRGTKVHDIVAENTLRIGDVETKTGGKSHSSFESRYFRDENFIIPHTARGIVSMVAPGVHTNGSQFYITLNPTKHLDGRAVAFGRVTKGDNIIKEIEKVTCPALLAPPPALRLLTSPHLQIYTYRGVPARDITIGACGLIEVSGVSQATIYPQKKFSMASV
jgi:cyclophilin family peptidyl-prolyl cis-trans isomerase